jgi:RNA polymerase sigma factor (sigma-70 family)
VGFGIAGDGGLAMRAVATAVGRSVAKPDLEALLSKWQAWIKLLAMRGCRRLRVLELEDLHADIVAAIVENFPKFDPELGGFGTFIKWRARGVVQQHAIKLAQRCHRESGNPYRCRGQVLRSDDEDEGADPFEITSDPSPVDVVEEVDRRELFARVRAAVAMLPADEQKAICRRFGLGKKVTGKVEASAKVECNRAAKRKENEAVEAALVKLKSALPPVFISELPASRYLPKKNASQ